MKIDECNAFVRFARIVIVDTKSGNDEVIPLDSRLFLCVEGNGKIICSNKEYKFRVNDVLIIPQGIKYKIMYCAETVKYISLNFDFTQKSSEIKIPIYPVKTNNFKKSMLIEDEIPKDFSEPVFLHCDSETLRTMLEILQEYSKKIEHFDSIIGHKLSCSLLLISRNLIIELKEKRKDVEKILDFIRENYSKDISNELIGKAFGFNKHYVSELIKKYTGIPLHKYLLNVRLSNAVALLESGNYNVSQVARMCGFNDIYYFSAYFKKQFKVSPKNYR